MSISALSSAAPAATPPAPATARAADGDYLAKSAKTSQTKDSDGDFKAATAAPTSAAAKTSSTAQAALIGLKQGG